MLSIITIESFNEVEFDEFDPSMCVAFDLDELCSHR